MFVFVLCRVCTMFHCVCNMFMCLYYVYHLTTGLLDLDAGQLARSQNPEGPATGHLDPGFLGFPGSWTQMLGWFPFLFQVATACLPCSPPQLNLDN